MNIIEQRYELMKNALRMLMDNDKKLDIKKKKLIVTTLTFIYPANAHGFEIQMRLAEIETEMIKKAAIVIPVLGRTMAINEIEDEIDKAIGLSKKYTDDTIKDHDGLGDPHFTKDDNKFLDNLTKASKPQ